MKHSILKLFTKVLVALLIAVNLVMVVQPEVLAKPVCSAAYPDVCIAPPPPDLDCKDIKAKNFRVGPGDPHGFDRDGTGIGCEQKYKLHKLNPTTEFDRAPNQRDTTSENRTNETAQAPNQRDTTSDASDANETTSVAPPNDSQIAEDDANGFDKADEFPAYFTKPYYFGWQPWRMGWQSRRFAPTDNQEQDDANGLDEADKFPADFTKPYYFGWQPWMGWQSWRSAPTDNQGQDGGWWQRN